MREKELRLALVCYGGVSLVVYMHGVTKELWKLLKASEARLAGRESVAGDTQAVWHAFLNSICRTSDLRVLVDVVAGASAGGINGILLGAAIVEGHDLEALTDLWLEHADVDRLLDPDARPGSRFVRFYKEPVAWYAQRRSETLANLRSDAGGRDVAEKLARFVRSRWFKPPFSGPGFTAKLMDAAAAMAAGRRGPPLLPATLSFDLFVTVTDYFGTRTGIPIHSPPLVTETEHRRILAFHSPPTIGLDHRLEPAPAAGPQRTLASTPSLVFAARATASFPGAFPAASIGEVDALVADRGLAWPDRDWLVRTQLAGDRPAEEMLLIDGSVLNNAPFEPAIAAIRLKSAYREVDRRFVYIDPKPGMPLIDAGIGRGRPPGFLTAMLRALAQIPREQPIRDNLEEIARLSAAAARARAVVDGMTPSVEAAIARAVGPRFLFLPLTVDRMAKAQAHVAAQAARESGFAHAAYAELRAALVVEEAAAALARLVGADAAAVRAATLHLRKAMGPDPTAIDTGFRLRRLRFVIRRLNAAIEADMAASARNAAEAAKAVAYQALAGFREADAALGEATRAAAGALLAGDAAAARAALAGLAADRDLAARDRACDAALLKALGARQLPRAIRHATLRDWIGYPFFDIGLLPLLADGGIDSLDAIKVDRISPDDCSALGRTGVHAVLKGWRLNAFGAFFSRAWRENDYLWGRLHAAERLVDIVLSALPAEDAAAIDDTHWKRALFRAILASERGRLSAIGELVTELEGELE